MMILFVLVALVIIYLAGNMLKQVVRNKRAFLKFEKTCRNLSILPKPNMFVGHISIWWYPMNYKRVHDLHTVYGKTYAFFIGERPVVSTTDLDLLKITFEKHNDRFDLGVPVKEFEESMLQVTGEKWRGIRRAVGPSLTNYKVQSEAITSDIEKIVAQLQRLLEHRSKNSSSQDGSFVIEATHAARRYAFSVINLIAFKREHNIDCESEKDEAIDDITQVFETAHNPFIFAGLVFPFLRGVSRVLTKYHKFGKKVQQLIEHANKVAELDGGRVRRTESAENGDSKQLSRRLVDEVIDKYLAKKISFNEMSGSLFTLFVAGYETAAATISNLIWLLALHPSIQDKLRASILVSGADAEYLHWCILESIRLYPPVPMGAGRTNSHDIKHGDALIPKGTFITPSLHTIHRNPEIWPQPLEFLPDRWADQSGFHPAAFLGFGLGPRNCVGSKLAMHEIKLAFRMILTHYRIERCHSTPDNFYYDAPILFLAEISENVFVKMVPL